jgi:hypothetical protein
LAKSAARRTARSASPSGAASRSRATWSGASATPSRATSTTARTPVPRRASALTWPQAADAAAAAGARRCTGRRDDA